jgi:ABC-2 type transport system ATP-binding protein
MVWLSRLVSRCSAEDTVRDIAIEARGLTKRYDDAVAVRDVSFAIERGEIVGFLGHNGAGKSTTMRMIAGSLVPSAGTALIAGFDVTTDPIAAKRNVGYLPEVPPLTPELRVDEQLALAAALKGLSGRRARTAIDDSSARCLLGDDRRRLVGTLSKGQQQRVGIAQALIGAPPVLILDEPTSGLDARQNEGLRELIRGLAGTHTVLLSTHILTEVALVCSRVLIVRQGAVVVDEGLAALRARHGDQSLEEIFLAEAER